MAEVFARAEALTEAHTAHWGTRTLDVLHVATALTLGAREFISFDSRQGKLAAAAGLEWHSG